MSSMNVAYTHTHVIITQIMMKNTVAKLVAYMLVFNENKERKKDKRKRNFVATENRKFDL